MSFRLQILIPLILATLTLAGQLATAQIPSGSYCGSAFGTSVEAFIANNGFNLVVGGSPGCSVQGTYTLSGSNVVVSPVQSNCGSSLEVGAVVWSSTALTVSGTSKQGGFMVQLTYDQCSALGILPSGVYCGTALGYSASVVLLHKKFVFLVDGPAGCSVSGDYSTIPGTTTLFVSITYPACGSALSLSSASYSVTDGFYTLSFTGTALGQSFTALSSTAQCGSGIPMGVYCANVLNTPASIEVISNVFRLNLEGAMACSITGTYTISGQSVAYQPLLSTCSLSVTSVTYSNGDLTVSGNYESFGSGSEVLINFTGTAAKATCETDTVPNGLYCGRVQGIRAEISIIGLLFRFVVGGPIPCQIEGVYWYHQGSVSLSITNNNCNSNIGITSIAFANGIITVSGTSELGAFTGTLSQGPCTSYVIPSGSYCVASSPAPSSPSQVVIAGNTFSQDSTSADYPSSTWGFYILSEPATGGAPTPASILQSGSDDSSNSDYTYTVAMSYSGSTQIVSFGNGDDPAIQYSQSSCIYSSTYAIQSPTYKVSITIIGYHYTWTYLPAPSGTTTLTLDSSAATAPGSCITTGTYILGPTGSATLFPSSGSSCIGTGLTSLAFHDGQIQFTATDNGNVIQGTATVVDPPSLAGGSNSHAGAIIGGTVTAAFIVAAIIGAKVYAAVASSGTGSRMDRQDLHASLNDEAENVRTPLTGEQHKTG